jgi:hypothetical protein
MSTSMGTILAVNAGQAVTMSSGASDAIIRSVRAAASDANLSFREEALTMKDVAGPGCSVIGVRGVMLAYNIGKLFEFKNRELVVLWQQRQQLLQRQQHFISALNSHLSSGLDRHPLPSLNK